MAASDVLCPQRCKVWISEDVHTGFGCEWHCRQYVKKWLGKAPHYTRQGDLVRRWS
jgi:hypothetical protein